jgi:hypothetical protein
MTSRPGAKKPPVALKVLWQDVDGDHAPQHLQDVVEERVLPSIATAAENTRYFRPRPHPMRLGARAC